MQSLEGIQTVGSVPLVVDVDGTLIGGDLLVESMVRLVAARPHRLFSILLWMLSGRAVLKRRIAELVAIEPATLNLNAVVIERINAARRDGREVYLASAADESYVRELAEHVGANGYFASDGERNLAGIAKAKRLIAEFGQGRFDYIGNEWRDLVVWKAANHAIAVGPSGSLRKRISAVDPAAEVIEKHRSGLADYLKELRPHQWVKNILVFTPLVAAHDLVLHELALTGIAFLCLSLCASGTYVFNDILDLAHDRQHATKRFRPLASGRIRIASAALMGAALIIGGLAWAFATSTGLFGIILAYLIATSAYSLYLKRKTFVDVVALATLYTMRILAGATVALIPLSHWFLAFSIFIFLALAIVKRLREIIGLRHAGKEKSSGRAYFVEDLPVLAALAGASSFAAVVVLALYINSPEIAEHYGRPDFLWLLCPLLVYWLGRVVLLTNRGVVADDPIVFALIDRASWVVALCAAATFIAAL
ncbi:MAG TPA: UbiA family prenyltransferase [Stellaceae bacterium]|nr:UbiA family prenyltransferase [Stellaceae bacterium]